MIDLLPEAVMMALLTITGYFCRSVLSELKQIRTDLHKMALNHGERIVMLEARYSGVSTR